MVNRESFYKNIKLLMLSGSLLAFPLSYNFLHAYQEDSQKKNSGIIQTENKKELKESFLRKLFGWIPKKSIDYHDTEKEREIIKKNAEIDKEEINFKKEKGYIDIGDRAYSPKYKYHDIESIMNADGITLDDLRKDKDNNLVGIIELFDERALVDVRDEADKAGILVRYSGEDKDIISKDLLSIEEAKKIVRDYATDEGHMGGDVRAFEENCSQLKEGKLERILVLGHGQKQVFYYGDMFNYHIKKGKITDVEELTEEQYARANRSRAEFSVGQSFPEKDSYSMKLNHAGSGLVEGARFKAEGMSSKNNKEIKAAIARTKQDNTKYSAGLGLFNIKNNNQYGRIDEWDAFFEYLPSSLYILKNSRLSFLTGMTDTEKAFDAFKLNNFTLEQKLKTRSNPLLSLEAELNSVQQLPYKKIYGEKHPYIRFLAAHASGEDQYEWTWLNPDGSLNSNGSFIIPSNYTTLSGDLGVKGKNVSLSGGSSLNILRREEQGKIREYRHSISNAEASIDLDKKLLWDKIKADFDIIYQNHSVKGPEGKKDNLALNTKIIFPLRNYGAAVNYGHDWFNGNYELKGTILLSPLSKDYIEEKYILERKQSLYDKRNNNNFLKGASPEVMHVYENIPRGIEITGALGKRNGEEYVEAVLGAYLLRKAGFDLGYKSVKKSNGIEDRITAVIKKAF